MPQEPLCCLLPVAVTPPIYDNPSFPFLIPMLHVFSFDKYFHYFMILRIEILIYVLANFLKSIFSFVLEIKRIEKAIVVV